MWSNLTPEQTLVLSATVAFVIALIATVTDVRTGKVYNWLTAPAMLVGVALSLLSCRVVARTPAQLQTAAHGVKVPFAGATALAVLTAMVLGGPVHLF